MPNRNKNIAQMQSLEEMQILQVDEHWKSNLLQKINQKPKNEFGIFYAVLTGLVVFNIAAIGYTSLRNKTTNISKLERNEMLRDELLVSFK
ncbi:MAG: hypothetical protein RLZZ118_357 [Bacteroidota bacterium]|jgi:hypothetical protein